MPWKQSEESRTWQKERVIQELRSQGKRMTKQRMVLLDVILSGKWNCCKEIYYEAAKRDAAIGMATVYRMVSRLQHIRDQSQRRTPFLEYPLARTSSGSSGT